MRAVRKVQVMYGLSRGREKEAVGREWKSEAAVIGSPGGVVAEKGEGDDRQVLVHSFGWCDTHNEWFALVAYFLNTLQGVDFINKEEHSTTICAVCDRYRYVVRDLSHL